MKKKKSETQETLVVRDLTAMAKARRLVRGQSQVNRRYRLTYSALREALNDSHQSKRRCGHFLKSSERSYEK
jgi:hypothetical protein